MKPILYQLSKTFALAALAGFFLAIVACTHLTLQRSELIPSAQPQTIELHSYILGLFSSNPLNEAQLCPGSHFESMALQMSSRDVALMLVTLGIYVPYRAELNCSAVNLNR